MSALPSPGTAFRLSPWLRALAALLAAVVVQFAISSHIKANSFWVALVYLAALVACAWQGYVQGLVAAVLVRFVIPYTVAVGFAASKAGWVATSIIFLIPLTISRLAERVRQSEELLRQQIRTNTAELEMLYSKLPVGLCFLDRSFRFRRINERLAAVNGKLPDEHIGRTVYEILPSAVTAQVRPVFEQVMSTGEPVQNFEFEAHSASDGRIRWWNINCSAVTTPDGTVSGLQIVVFDVTEQYESARALAVANEELRQVNDDLSQFAYIAAHDLQEPLRTVITFAQLVQRRCSGQLDGSTDQQLTFIVNAGQRMAHLISDVLAYSSMGIDDHQQPEPVTLDGLLTTVCEGITGVEWSNLPIVVGFPRQLQQLFSNLIGNAVKYRRPEVPLRVVVESAPEDDRYVRITVRDNGQGFKQEYADRIFGIFRRLHGKDVAGSGIGLAICKRVVERHGGHIWADAVPGVGAAFHFTLPARSGSPALTRAQAQDSSQSLQR